MIARTSNPRSVSWDRYGGKGIVVCQEWMHFEPFMEWAYANGYHDSLEIDRRDGKGNYEPGNCRWVTKVVQSRNRDCTRSVEAFGEIKLLCEWAEDTRCSVAYGTLWRRIVVFEWAPERAISKPVRKPRCEVSP